MPGMQLSLSPCPLSRAAKAIRSPAHHAAREMPSPGHCLVPNFNLPGSRYLAVLWSKQAAGSKASQVQLIVPAESLPFAPLRNLSSDLHTLEQTDRNHMAGASQHPRR